jgi:uncharacterized membrane protein (DUF4010 family)
MSRPLLVAFDMADATALAVALAIGLLVGVERERRKGEGRGRDIAGIRTFALVGLLGGLAMLVGGAVVVGAGLVVLGALTAVGYLAGDHDDPGITTEVALIVTFLLGALALDEPVLAAGIGVLTTALLAARSALHRLVSQLMTEDELHDLLLFVAAAGVVLPLLPDRDMGPYEALNPFAIWRLVVLVMGIGGTGYVALRVLGPRFGLPLAGLAGGFVSSSATIASMGALARRAPALGRAAVAGAVLSTVATVLQLVVVLAAASRPTLRELGLSLALAGGVALAFGALTALRIPATDEPTERPATRAFQLQAAILFAAIVTGVTLLSAALNDALGSRGVILSAAVAGFADTHAAAASVAALVARGQLDATDAVLPILMGFTTNTVTKASLAFANGRWPFARLVWLGLLAVLVAAWAGGAVVLP